MPATSVFTVHARSCGAAIRLHAATSVIASLFIIRLPLSCFLPKDDNRAAIQKLQQQLSIFLADTEFLAGGSS